MSRRNTYSLSPLLARSSTRAPRHAYMSSLRLWSQNPLLSPQRIQCQSGTEHERHFLGHDWKRNLLQGFIAAAKVNTLTRVDVKENIVVSARQNRNENETWTPIRWFNPVELVRDSCVKGCEWWATVILFHLSRPCQIPLVIQLRVIRW